MQHLIVTGGTGYIGERVVDLALQQGRRVTLLGRKAGPAQARHIRWTLGDPFPQDALLADLTNAQQALVHLAHDWQGEEARSVDDTRLLFEGAKTLGLGARVFVSSQSAREDALNRYGRLKWSIEQQIGDAVSLRVGLVYGGPQKAMFGLLQKITQLPVLPMVDPHRCVQPIHRDEVVQGIFASIDQSLTGVFGLAGPVTTPFGDVLKAFARGFRGGNLLVIPIPLQFALWGCRVTERLPFLPTIDRERVLGLAGTEPIETKADLAQLGISVVPLDEGLAREPRGRKALLAEGRAFLSYAMGTRPESILVRRYARAFRREGALARPKFGLGWREPVCGNSPLAARLRAAARIAETSPRAEIKVASLSSGVRFIKLCFGLLLEVLKLPSRLLFGR